MSTAAPKAIRQLVAELRKLNDASFPIMCGCGCGASHKDNQLGWAADELEQLCDAWDAALELDSKQSTPFWSPTEIQRAILGEREKNEH